MSDDKDDIDWSLTTWEGSRRAQLRHALRLTLRERMEAVEGLADVARRFQQMRERGELKRVPRDAKSSRSDVVREQEEAYRRKKKKPS